VARRGTPLYGGNGYYAGSGRDLLHALGDNREVEGEIPDGVPVGTGGDLAAYRLKGGPDYGPRPE
jgi:hypothetical protein